jgi:hypothetical protein
MNDETYEDDVDDDDDNNNNNNTNALQFYHTIIWSILVDYIVDSHILCLFFFLPLSFDILYDIDQVTNNNNNKQYY